jgi:hypothetical protein
MHLEKLKLIRNILFRATLICLVMSWLLAAMTVMLWDTWSNMTAQLFHKPVSDLGPMISNWFALIKFYILFVLLAPALAIQWEIRRQEK